MIPALIYNKSIRRVRTMTQTGSVFTPARMAALTVAPLIVGLELLSSLIPGVGYLIGLPVAIGVYFLQGALVVWLLRRDSETVELSLGKLIGQSSISALWSGVILSALVTLVSLGIEIPATGGVILVGLPAVLIASGVDILLSQVFTLLGAWLYYRSGSQGLVRGSCLLLGVGAAGFLLLFLGLLALLTGGAFGYIVHHIIPGR